MMHSILLAVIMMCGLAFGAGELRGASLTERWRPQPAADPGQAADRVPLWADLASLPPQRMRIRARLELKQQGGSEVLEQDFVLRLAAVGAAPDDPKTGEKGQEGGNDSDATETPGAAVHQRAVDRPLLRAAIESLSITTTASGDTLRFVWPEPDDPPPGSPALTRIGRALAESVLEFEVGEDGRARLVAGLERARLAAEEGDEGRDGSGNGGAPVRFMGVLAPGAIDRIITSIITLDPQRRPRAPGETWHAHTEAGALGRKASIITESTLRRIEGHTAVVEGDVKVVLEGAGSTPPGTPRASIAEQHGTFEARWDLRQRRLAHQLWETSAQWEVSLATEPPIIARTTSIARIEITPADPPPPQR